MTAAVVGLVIVIVTAVVCSVVTTSQLAKAKQSEVEVLVSVPVGC